MDQVLRDYQVEMLERLRQAWSGIANPRQQSVMVQMPTGTGKTYLMAEVIRTITNKQETINGGGVLVVAHRIELIEQISRTLDRFGIKHGILNKGFSFNNALELCSLATNGTQEMINDKVITISLLFHKTLICVLIIL